MAVLTPVSITKVGSTLTSDLVAADAAGDSVPVAQGLLMVVDNGDTASHTVTITAPSSTVNCPSYGTLPLEDIVHTIAAGERFFFVVPNGYADSGSFTWSYDDVTSVTVGVFTLNSGG